MGGSDFQMGKAIPNKAVHFNKINIYGQAEIRDRVIDHITSKLASYILHWQAMEVGSALSPELHMSKLHRSQLLPWLAS